MGSLSSFFLSSLLTRHSSLFTRYWSFEPFTLNLEPMFYPRSCVYLPFTLYSLPVSDHSPFTIYRFSLSSLFTDRPPLQGEDSGGDGVFFCFSLVTIYSLLFSGLLSLLFSGFILVTSNSSLVTVFSDFLRKNKIGAIINNATTKKGIPPSLCNEL